MKIIDETRQIVTVTGETQSKVIPFTELTTLTAFLTEVESKITFTESEKSAELAKIQSEIDALNAKKAKINSKVTKK